MLAGKSLQELAMEVQRQQEAKRDFLVAMPKVKAYAQAGEVELAFALQEQDLLNVSQSNDFFAGTLTNTGHVQAGQWAGIPKPYYDLLRTKDHVGLLATNLQHWLNHSSDRRLIRVLDGKIRAILSDRYRRLDNWDLVNAILPMLHDAGATVVSCEITETKLYIKALVHSRRMEVKVGDEVEAGIMITNSEIGAGSLSVKPFIHQLICLNGNVIDELAMRKYHVGRRQDEFAQIEFSNETNLAEDKAFWLKTRDLVKHSLSESTLTRVVRTMQEADKRIIRDPKEAVELVTKKFKFIEDEKDSIVKHLIEGGSLTSYGLGNAITKTAHADITDYDRSTELESFGFQAMQMNFN
jgi:hypothetical protein